MTDQEKLYETLGELLYAVAMAGGVIQKEEEEALEKLLHNHGWAHEVSWSFQYEQSRNTGVQEAYKKAISFYQHHGPSPIYQEFIDAMSIVAAAANGTDQKEEALIHSFSKDLISRFQRELDLGTKQSL